VCIDDSADLNQNSQSDITNILIKYDKNIKKIVTTEIIILLFGNNLFYKNMPTLKNIHIIANNINNIILEKGIIKFNNVFCNLVTENDIGPLHRKDYLLKLENFLKIYPENLLNEVRALTSYYPSIGTINLKKLEQLWITTTYKITDFENMTLNLPNLTNLEIDNYIITKNYKINFQNGVNCDLSKLSNIKIKGQCSELYLDLPELYHLYLINTRLQNIGYIDAPKLCKIEIDKLSYISSIFAEKSNICNLTELSISQCNNLLMLADSPDFINFNLEKLQIYQCEHIGDFINDCNYFDFTIAELIIKYSNIKNFNIKCSPKILNIIRSTIDGAENIDFTSLIELELKKTNIVVDMPLPLAESINISIHNFADIDINNYPKLKNISVEIIK